MYWGDYRNIGQTEEFQRDTVGQDGERATVVGGALAVYRLGTASALAATVVFVEDFYGTGSHQAQVPFGHASMATPGSFILKWTAGTCDGIPLEGGTFCEFSHGRYASPEEFLDAVVPASNDAGTVADCLNAARAQGFGRWALDEGTNELTLYGADDSTIVKVFDIDDLDAPLTRTPQ